MAAEAIAEEDTTHVEIVIMATIATEKTIEMPSRSQPWVVKKIEMNHNLTNREAMETLKPSIRAT